MLHLPVFFPSGLKYYFYNKLQNKKNVITKFKNRIFSSDK